MQTLLKPYSMHIPFESGDLMKKLPLKPSSIADVTARKNRSSLTGKDRQFSQQRFANRLDSVRALSKQIPEGPKVLDFTKDKRFLQDKTGNEPILISDIRNNGSFARDQSVDQDDLMNSDVPLGLI